MILARSKIDGRMWFTITVRGERVVLSLDEAKYLYQSLAAELNDVSQEQSEQRARIRAEGEK